MSDKTEETIKPLAFQASKSLPWRPQGARPKVSRASRGYQHIQAAIIATKSLNISRELYSLQSTITHIFSNGLCIPKVTLTHQICTEPAPGLDLQQAQGPSQEHEQFQLALYFNYNVLIMGIRKLFSKESDEFLVL
jgi:hypothetical protein